MNLPKTRSQWHPERLIKRNRKLVFCLCAILAFAFYIAGESMEPAAHSSLARTADEQRWKGKYVNFEYGYSLAIPTGLIGVSPPAPWPQHGIEIRLDQKEHAQILTNADFSASDYPSLDAAVDSDLREAEKNKQNLTVTSRKRQQLGSLNAIRVVMKYKNNSSDSTTVEETITASRRTKRPEEAVLYTIRLVTIEGRYAHDRRVFYSVLRSWRLRPLPK